MYIYMYSVRYATHVHRTAPLKIAQKGRYGEIGLYTGITFTSAKILWTDRNENVTL